MFFFFRRGVEQQSFWPMFKDMETSQPVQCIVGLVEMQPTHRPTVFFPFLNWGRIFSPVHSISRKHTDLQATQLINWHLTSMCTHLYMSTFLSFGKHTKYPFTPISTLIFTFKGLFFKIKNQQKLYMEKERKIMLELILHKKRFQKRIHGFLLNAQQYNIQQ